MYPNGTRIITRIEQTDEDSEGVNRVTPAGTAGTVSGYTEDDDEPAMSLYDIAWDNGAWTRWTGDEIRNDAELCGAVGDDGEA